MKTLCGGPIRIQRRGRSKARNGSGATQVPQEVLQAAYGAARGQCGDDSGDRGKCSLKNGHTGQHETMTFITGGYYLRVHW